MPMESEENAGQELVLAHKALPAYDNVGGLISGYRLAEEVLNRFGDSGVRALLECVGHGESEWLECKTSHLLSEEERFRKLSQDSLYWDIAVALFAMANTSGGVVLIGVGTDNRKVFPVDVANDPEGFLRTKIMQKILPDQRVWSDGKGGRWESESCPSVEPRICSYDDGDRAGNVVVLLVEPRPIGAPLLLQDAINRNGSILPQRVSGIGKTVLHRDGTRFEQLDRERRIERSMYFHLLCRLVPSYGQASAGSGGGAYRMKGPANPDASEQTDPTLHRAAGRSLRCVFAAGDRIGRYVVRVRLGEGGMGVVYRVEDEGLRREYALKAFKATASDSWMQKDRFKAEARLLAELSHPGLPKVYEFAYDEKRECLYLVQDLIVGPGDTSCPLEGYIVKDSATPIPSLKQISCDQALVWLRQVCEIVEYLHGQGVVHRDISLRNLLVTRDNRVMLTDFGVAKVKDQELRRKIDSQVTMTFTQTPGGQASFIGTLHYLPPEVKDKRKSDVIPESSDVWAIGVSFFKLLTGKWPDHEQFDDYDWHTGVWGRLIRGMLCTNSTRRMTCQQVLSELDREETVCGDSKKRSLDCESNDAVASTGHESLALTREGGPNSFYSNIPAAVPTFVGREIELRELDDLLWRSPRKIPLIHAFAGSGKTELALKYAEKYRDKYDLCLLLHGEGKRDLRDLFLEVLFDRKICRILGLDDLLLEGIRVRMLRDNGLPEEERKRFWDVLRTSLIDSDVRETLILIDNVDSLGLLHPVEVGRFLSGLGTQRLHIYATSRLNNLNVDGDSIVVPYEVSGLPLDVGVNLLNRKCAFCNEAETRAATEIVRLLDGNAWALDIVGEDLRQRDVDLQDGYRNKLSVLKSLSPLALAPESDVVRIQHGCLNPVALMRPTLAHLPEELRDVLEICSFFPPDYIQDGALRLAMESLWEEEISDREWHGLLRKLDRFSLLNIPEVVLSGKAWITSYMRIHRLTMVVLRQQARNKLAELLPGVLAYIKARRSFHSDLSEEENKCFADFAVEWQKLLTPVQLIDTYLCDFGYKSRRSDLVAVLNEAVKKYKLDPVADPVRLSFAESRLLDFSGDEIWEILPDGPRVAYVFKYRRAHRMREQVLPKDSLLLAMSYNRLASELRLSDYEVEDEVELQKQAVAVAERAQHVDRRWLAQFYANLADIYRDRKDVQAAEECSGKSRRMCPELFLYGPAKTKV